MSRRRGISLGAKALIILAGIMATGCEDVLKTTGDFDFAGPVVNAEIVGSMLFTEAYDEDSSIFQLEVFVENSLKATYVSGYRSIAFSLENLGYGTFEICIKASDMNNNSTYRRLVYENEAYLRMEQVESNYIEAIWNLMGAVVANLKITRKSVTWIPVVPGVPSRPDEAIYEYELINITPITAYKVYITISGFDDGDSLLWSHTRYLGTLYPGVSRDFTSDLTTATSPERFVVSLYSY